MSSRPRSLVTGTAGFIGSRQGKRLLIYLQSWPEIGLAVRSLRATNGSVAIHPICSAGHEERWDYFAFGSQ